MLDDVTQTHGDFRANGLHLDKKGGFIMTDQSFLSISLVILFIGFIFLGLSGISFRWRAFTNKPAWNGLTKPFLLIGLLTFIIGLILVYIFYPK